MQLFSIGLYQLNLDGTNKLDSSGNPILSYDNTDIQNFARAWTGFTRSRRRSNIELTWWEWDNRLDPMTLRGKRNFLYYKNHFLVFISHLCCAFVVR